MEGDVAFDLLDDLVDVPVEHGHRTEALQIAERPAGVRRAPAPLLVDRLQWQVGHQHDRRARGTAGNILFQPFELLGPSELDTARTPINSVRGRRTGWTFVLS